MKKILLIGIVAIVIVLGIIGIVYFDYNRRINDKINMIQVPVAKYEIEEGLIIREDMITLKEMSPKEINENTYKIVHDVIGKISTKKIGNSQYFTTENIK